MRKRLDITAARLREVLRYEPETGLFFWRVDIGTAKAGDVAGSPHNKGYVQIMVDGHNWLAHRLAWMYMTGGWPPHVIDHRDTRRSNNVWTNLRPATSGQNSQNMRKAAASNKSSGLLGATLHACGRWMAQIKLNRKRYYLGLFDTAQEAHEAYVKAKREMHAFGTL